MEVNFGSQEEKEAFLRRLQWVESSTGGWRLDNHGAMFDTVEGSTSGCASDRCRRPSFSVGIIENNQNYLS